MSVSSATERSAGSSAHAGSASDTDVTVAAGYDGGGDGVDGWAATLSRLAPAADDGSRIDQIRMLEDIKAGCAAAQARITAAFAASQREANTPASDDGDAAAMREGTAGAPDRVGPAPAASAGTAAARAQRRAKAVRLASRSAAAQIALARRESPQRGGRFVGLADVLVGEMPSTLAALEAGVINEYRAMIIVRETACLSRDQRAAVDAEIADNLDGLGDSRIEALVKGIAYRIDPEAATKRAVRAAGDRRVSLRPAPDAMGYLTGLMPIAAAVACYAALCRHVDTQPAEDGDTRTRDQRIIDEYIARITGSSGGGRRAQDEGASGVPPVPNPTTPASGKQDLTEEPPEKADGCASAEDGDAGACDGTSPQQADGREPDAHDGAPPPSATPRSDDDQGGTRSSTEHDRPTAENDAEPTDVTERHPAGATTGPDTVEDPVAAVRDAYERAVQRDRVRHRSPDPVPDESPPDQADRTGPAPGAEGSARGDPPAEPAISDAPREQQPARDPASAHDFPSGTGVVINLVITDRTLFADGADPALLPGNHPIPGPLARRMVSELPDSARMWIRRLYTRPGSGELVAADSQQRTFPLGMRHILFTRDQICRTPWCNAPARHADHVKPCAEGGATSLANGQALSEDCNYTRTAPGWSAHQDPDQPGRIIVTTPTGHSYPSPCPDLLPGHTDASKGTADPDRSDLPVSTDDPNGTDMPGHMDLPGPGERAGPLGRTG